MRAEQRAVPQGVSATSSPAQYPRAMTHHGGRRPAARMRRVGDWQRFMTGCHNCRRGTNSVIEVGRRSCWLRAALRSRQDKPQGAPYIWAESSVFVPPVAANVLWTSGPTDSCETWTTDNFFRKAEHINRAKCQGSLTNREQRRRARS